MLWKLYQLFSGVWHDLGFAWDDVESWMMERHIPAMQVIHVEVNPNSNNLGIEHLS